MVGCCASVGSPSADPAASEHHLLLPLSDLRGTAVLQQLVVYATGSIISPSLSSHHWPQPAVIVLTIGHVAEKNAPTARGREKKKKEGESEVKYPFFCWNGFAAGYTDLQKPQ